MNKVFVIAEVGINHNGDLEIAKDLVKGAKWAGADAVKFQKRNVRKVYSKEYLEGKRESPWGHTQLEQKQGLEFGKTEYDEIDKVCKEIGIKWFASPWDLSSVEFLKSYNLEYNKIASAMLTYTKLLEEIAKQGKYTFISTGMSTMEEIDAAVKIFKYMCCPFELMHCNSQYPLPNNKVNLNCMLTLKERFKCKIGYSCHSPEMIVPVYAVALGATSIEKHITLDRTMYGSDQSASMELEGFRKMIKYIREAEVIFGDGKKVVTEEEAKSAEKLRRNFDY